MLYKHCLAILVTITISTSCMTQLPKVSHGTIRRLENFESKFVPPRNVDIWLPEGYAATTKYPVLYMHDGKGLFDSAIMWNHQEWGIDETLSRLVQGQKIQKCIVVGIWNSEATRHLEYFPQRPFEWLTKQQQDTIFNTRRENGELVFAKPIIQSDSYLQFMVTELKPYIDANFNTLSDAAHTFIAGSSMGGLISIYAICEYPNVFGGAACLSTHWPGVVMQGYNPIPPVFMAYLKKYLPSPAGHRLYFDYGTETLDALYKPFQQQADEIIKSKGYTATNWVTMEFTGANHSENAWNKRFEIPAIFLLQKENAP